MDALILLKEAQAAGLRIKVDGANLVVEGPKRAEPVVRKLQAHKLAVIGAIRRQWDQPLADALIQIALGQVSRAYDKLAPGCPVDGPGWDEAEALVDAALSTHNVVGLRAALAAYEQHARSVFRAWAGAKSELSSSPPPSTDQAATIVVEPTELEAAGLLEWMDSVDLPTEPFRLSQAYTVSDPSKFYGALRAGLIRGPGGPRWELAVRDARRLRVIVDKAPDGETEGEVAG